MNRISLLFAVVATIVLLSLSSCHSPMGGKVISKKHLDSYSMQMWQGGNYNRKYVPSEYVISVEVNGITTDFSVTQTEYNSIQIGDYYKLSE